MSRVVVITGGGTGIGAACARLMAAAGETVFITGRRLAPLQALAEETGAVALAGDAASGDEWQAHLLPTILERAGHIDVLICSAGGMGNGAVVGDQRPAVACGAGKQSQQRVCQRPRLPAIADCPARQRAVCRLDRLPRRRAAGLRLRHRQACSDWPDAFGRAGLWPTRGTRQRHLPRLGDHADGR